MADIAKIKRNLKRMIDQGAPKEHLDRYLAGEGVTVEELRAAPNQSARPDDGTRFKGAGAFLTSIAEGVPVAGPAILSGLQHVGAYGRSLRSGKPFAQELQTVRSMTDTAQEENPGLSMAGGITGAVAGLGPLAATGAGAKALGLVGRNLGTRTAASTMSGGAIGGADALARGEDPATGAMMGAGFGAVAPSAGQMVGAGFRRMMGASPRAASPTIDELDNAATAIFQRIDKSGTIVRQQKMDAIVNDVLGAARVTGQIDPTLHPDSSAVLQKVLSWRMSEPSLSELHQFRQILADAGSSPKPGDRRVAGLMMKAFDKHFDNLSAFDVVGPDPKSTMTELRSAMDMWHRKRKGEKIAQLFQNAYDKVGANYTQADLDTALKQELKSFRRNPRNLRGFTAEEKAMMERVVRGDIGTGTLRLLGRFAPRGPVSFIPAAAIGASADMGTGIAFGTAAHGFRKIAGDIGVDRARLLDETVRLGKRPPIIPLPPTAEIAKRLTHATSLGLPLSLYSTPRP